MRARTVVLALMGLLLAACGQGGELVDAGAAPARVTPTPSPTIASPSSASESATPQEGDGDPPELTAVTIGLTRDGRVERVRRVLPRVPRIGSAAIEQLLAGPTEEEANAGYRTQVPDGTRLRRLTITEGVALVDLSREFETGGESTALTLRLAQVVCTLDAFPTVDGVRIAVDGEVVQVVVGDGEVVDEPVGCDDYAGAT